MRVKVSGWALIAARAMLFHERYLTQTLQNTASVMSMCLLYSAQFSALEFFREQGLSSLLHALSLTLGPLWNLSICVGGRSTVQCCCWAEWAVLLFWLSCELFFFLFWSSVTVPMITFCLLNREWWVYWEGRGGAGEGGWGDHGSCSQNWPPTVIFGS